MLLEVNVAGEESKYGVPAEEVDRFVERASSSEKIVFAGLMTMPPFAERPEEARPYFARLRELGERLRREWAPRHEFAALSMGTSQDYEVAVEEGATIVRLGACSTGKDVRYFLPETAGIRPIRANCGLHKTVRSDSPWH